ncbi:sulfotransferase family 2 domain-containing protein [Glaciecola siphonariae]|uniref:Sulfotransferase family 2 domain-containing protein n=1 Tax=Glaciecola siphonariae TaxID=521012 RepID=A0ABV9LYC0_9ALTE
MIVSDSKQFIFLHIPKTAGTSVRKSLVPYAKPGESDYFSKALRRIMGHYTPYRFKEFRYHPHLTMQNAKRLMPASRFNNYFKFAFVRHPVDWQYAIFRHILSHRHIKAFEKRFDFIYRSKSFDEYITWRVTNGAIPQIFQMINEDLITEVDRVYKFENLQGDFEILCRKLGIPNELPFLNKNSSSIAKPVSDYARNLIYDAYRLDFEMFGYGIESVDDQMTYQKNLKIEQVSEIFSNIGEEYDVWALNKWKK